MLIDLRSDWPCVNKLCADWPCVDMLCADGPCVDILLDDWLCFDVLHADWLRLIPGTARRGLLDEDLLSSAGHRLEQLLLLCQLLL